MEDDYIHKDEVARLVRMAHMEGRIHERDKWSRGMMPKTMEIRVSVNDGEEQEAINIMLSFDQIKNSKGDMFRVVLQDTIRKIEEAPIISKLLTPLPPRRTPRDKINNKKYERHSNNSSTIRQRLRVPLIKRRKK